MDTGGEQRAGVLGPGVNMEAHRGDQEIRELFKSVHTPKGRLQFDEWGWVTLESCLGEVDQDYQGSPIASASNEPLAALPWPHWVPPSHPQLSIPRPMSPVGVISRWGQAMSAASSHSDSRASLAAHHPCSSADWESRRCSASPQCNHAHPAKAMPNQQVAFVEEL